MSKQKVGLQDLISWRKAVGSRLVWASFASLVAACGAAVAEETCAGPPSPGDPVAATGRVAAVNERLELTLEDGRLLRIAGLDPPRPTPNDPELDLAASKKLGAWLIGGEVAFRLHEARRDRWGRIAAQVFAPAAGAGSPALPVAEAALDAGLARFESGPAARSCRAALLAAEAAARSAALGLWADPYYAVLQAGDRDAFAERAGTSGIVEGRVTGVEQNAFRTTLLFGERRGRDFSVTVLQRNRKIFAAPDFDFAHFKGRTIRVRGLLDMRFGPQVEVSSPDEIETITQENDAAGPERAKRR
jgi:endonuclease YncB( thermonuclease family)